MTMTGIDLFFSIRLFKCFESYLYTISKKNSTIIHMNSAENKYVRDPAEGIFSLQIKHLGI
jgi:hypothetical protein